MPTGWCEPYQQLQAAYTSMKKPELASYAVRDGRLLREQGRRGQDPAHAPSRPGPPPSTRCSASAVIAETQSDTKGAAAWYQKALAKDPKNMAAMSSLVALGVTPTAKREEEVKEPAR